MRTVPVGVAILLLTGPAAPAQSLDLDKPYELNVVLDIAEHRLLTPVFRDQVRRELQDGLRTAFGDLVRVTVLEKKELQDDSNRPLRQMLEDVRKRGLGEPLEKWQKVTGVKTHFVLIDYVDGQYEVRARQHDGLTGQASPVIRRERIADRLFVARLATFFVDRDFGVVGAVSPGTAPYRLTVNFKGKKLGGAALGRWVKKGEVFRLVPIVTTTSTPRRLDDAYLVVEEAAAEGPCGVRLYNRYGVTVPQANTEYRCLHLPTIQAPLRVQLIQSNESRRSPAVGLHVTVRRNGFDGEEVTKLTKTTDNEGLVSTERERTQPPYDHIAFLTVKLTPRDAKVPVPIVDDRPVVVRVAVRPRDARSLLTDRKELWDQRAYEDGLVQKELFRELKEMESKANLQKEALKRAQEGLAGCQESRKQLGNDRDDLLKAAEAEGVKLDTAYADQWIKYIEEGNAKLEAYIAEHERIIKDENDPKRLEYLALVQQGKLEEARAEFSKALEIYEKALQMRFADAGLKKHHADLKTRWEPKNEEHRKARIRLESTFAGADLLKTPDAVKEAREDFLVCRMNRDVLGAHRLTQMILAHGGKLKQQRDALQPDINEQDRKDLEVIANVTGELRKLGLEVQAFVQENSK
jgi:hypothetical protein